MIFFKISIHYFLSGCSHFLHTMCVGVRGLKRPAMHLDYLDQPKVWFWKDHDKLVEGGGVHAEFTDDVLARNVVILLTE